MYASVFRSRDESRTRALLVERAVREQHRKAADRRRHLIVLVLAVSLGVARQTLARRSLRASRLRISLGVRESSS